MKINERGYRPRSSDINIEMWGIPAFKDILERRWKTWYLRDERAYVRGTM